MVKKAQHETPKRSKRRKSSSEEPKQAKISTLMRKQTELARVFDLKCSLMHQETLSYLEYMELRDEICRLKALKDFLANQAAELGKKRV